MEQPEKGKVLIVDDDAIMRALLKSILRLDGYAVVGEASNGEMAITMCGVLTIDIVCMDINMPKMGGMEALETIRKDYPELKVIMISGDSKTEVVREAISKGAKGYIVKPFNPGKVLDTIGRCLNPPSA